MIWATVGSWSCFWWLLQSLSIFGCKEYNQCDFGVDHLVMSMCRVLLCCWKRVFAMTSALSWQNSISLCFIPHSKAKFACYSGCFLTSYFCIYLDSTLKSRDITWPTKVHLVKAMVFPVVMYGCESWTIKKAKGWRINAFEVWCWRRLSRVPWTARRSNQSIPK